VPKLLFRLRNVPDDEAQEVRELLDENGVEFYETSAGNWGISLPGIWLADESDYHQARALLDSYQDQRAAQQRANYRELRSRGQAPTFWRLLAAKPLVVCLQVLALALLTLLSIRLFPGLL
jgi:hypothetical protein